MKLWCISKSGRKLKKDFFCIWNNTCIQYLRRMDSSHLKYSSAADVGLIEPSARVKQLAENGAAVTVDPNIPSRRYYQSGLEVVRMANVYLEEGNLQYAYILYIRFMTLFVEKIIKHPEYALVPAEMKASNQAQLKEVFPKAEKLKAKLLEQFTKEYNQCLADKKQKDAENAAKAFKKKKEENEKNKANALKAAASSNHPSAPPPESPLWNVVNPVPSVQGVLYPDDFATEPNRAPPENYEHAPPIIRENKPRLPSTSDSLYPSPPPTATSLLSGGSSLRTIMVPSFLLDRFLALAAPNTKKKIETCGILAGTLERDRLLITHMIVPKQNGTADSCITKNEEEIFNYQDQHNLITLGWIHTHPTQTAFLSSVDLHTQCSYQLMMPEAIAIVCAPKYNETRYFSLTPNYGMSFISNCRLTGFHPHPNDPPLFMDATHIILNEFSSLEVVDLRR